MPENTVADSTDPGTRRPNAPPLEKAGVAFLPMKLLPFDPIITLPDHVAPDVPIDLFTLYYTPEIIEGIVKHTNNYARAPKNPASKRSRCLDWSPTCSAEIYIYLAIRIYMTIHVENEISDYWCTKGMSPVHPISKKMARDRFQELHMRFRLEGLDAEGPYERVSALSAHIQAVNLSVWTPGRDVAVDEMMIRYEGRAKEATTIPGKPTPTGFKVWGVAQQGFLLAWNWHRPGKDFGPVGVFTPRELGATKSGRGGNKTQAVVLSLLDRLLLPTEGFGYHVFLDNLFMSTKFALYARTRSFGVTGTCRTNAGVLKDLLALKKHDDEDVIPWGTVYCYTTTDGLVSQVRWKDQAFVIMMSTLFSGREAKTKRLRKRPKETSSKAKTSRVPFKGQPEVWLYIPIIADCYNYGMGGVDEFDHLIAQNAGLRHVERGGHQAIEHWELRTVLSNCYVLASRSNVPLPRRPINFRS
ncbi:uncharacterized protein RCO7_07121 [Rhynchosporium graminicola]|uniref:PiggyBac transposable element-derived protein domain-containing protein n=1 Tax=Rhynchosporium graminicola TaxID=2792576 RepID=A0A1E1LTE2_9HELO|nr:uncharacterized protein RCO7_07121 [Rhynchosporium commune]